MAVCADLSSFLNQYTDCSDFPHDAESFYEYEQYALLRTANLTAVFVDRLEAKHSKLCKHAFLAISN